METIFGVPVPNLSTWRRRVTGDMTSALGLADPPDTSIPTLPDASLVEPMVDEQVIVNASLGTFDDAECMHLTRRRATERRCPSRSTTPPASDARR